MNINVITDLTTTNILVSYAIIIFLFIFIALCRLSYIKNKIVQDYRKAYLQYASNYAYKILELMKNYLQSCPKEHLCQNDLHLHLILNKSMENIDGIGNYNLYSYVPNQETTNGRNPILIELSTIASILSEEGKTIPFPRIRAMQ